MDEAADWYRRALATKPASKAALFQLGTALRALGQLEGQTPRAEEKSATEAKPDGIFARDGALIPVNLNNGGIADLFVRERIRARFPGGKPENAIIALQGYVLLAAMCASTTARGRLLPRARAG